VLSLLLALQRLPSAHTIATEHRMIPPAAQYAMPERAGAKLSDVAASHRSQPETVATLIAQAAAGVAGR